MGLCGLFLELFRRKCKVLSNLERLCCSCWKNGDDVCLLRCLLCKFLFFLCSSVCLPAFTLNDETNPTSSLALASLPHFLTSFLHAFHSSAWVVMWD